MASAAPAQLADEAIKIVPNGTHSQTGITNGTNGTVKSKSTPPDNRTWWKEASVYQIYPASFKDSNGDGVGDIQGIISKVNYIKALGTDVVWLCPVYKSPQVDMGYDISDYEDIDPQYGTLEDVDELISELHKRDIKLVMDLVVNHCSDQHYWFKEARKSKDNPYRNWFHWHPGKIVDGKRVPPNNWASYFRGSAWTWEESTQEYYLHLFAAEQPDLNWENPEVVNAVHDLMRFWMKRGVDGWRMDVINFISKVPGYPEASITDPDPNAIYQNGSEHFANGPRLHEFFKGIGKVLKEFDAFSVGEMPAVKDPNEIVKAVGFDREELNMIFHFELVDIDYGAGWKFTHRDFSLKDFKRITAKWQDFMYFNSGWNALYLENHDQPRTVSRFCDDSPEYRVQSAKMLATCTGFQAGTPYIYQGQELGMVNVPKEWGMEEYKDLECVNHWVEVQTYIKDQKVLDAFRVEYQKKSRDNARTPMQWANAPHGGFTESEVKPWMRANPSYEFINAESQVNDPASAFSFYKEILKLRKEYVDVFVYGAFELVDGTEEDEDLLVYRRTYKGHEAVVVCNWSGKSLERSTQELGLGEALDSWKVLLENDASFQKGANEVKIRPWSSFVLYRAT